VLRFRLLLLCSLRVVAVELVVLVVAVHLRVVATRQVVQLLPVYKPQPMVGRSLTIRRLLFPM
jgi:hypothetical protein